MTAQSISTAPPAASGTDSSLDEKPRPPRATGAAANSGVTCARGWDYKYNNPRGRDRVE